MTKLGYTSYRGVVQMIRSLKIIKIYNYIPLWLLCIALYYCVLHYIIVYCLVLLCGGLYYCVLLCITVYYFVLLCIVEYQCVLLCIIVYCFVLLCIVLYCSCITVYWFVLMCLVCITMYCSVFLSIAFMLHNVKQDAGFVHYSNLSIIQLICALLQLTRSS